MDTQVIPISLSIDLLEKNLIKIAQVGEWADLMGYKTTKNFSRKFLRHYSIRPCKILTSIRLKSIYQQLHNGKISNFEVARRHSLPDEKALNKFVNYHLNCCPSQLKLMSENQLNARLEKLIVKFDSKVR